MPSRVRASPYPFEWFALVSTAVVILFLRAQGFRVGLRALDLTLSPMFATLPRVLALGVVLEIVRLLVARQQLRAAARRFLEPVALLLWFRVCLSLMLVTFSYSWLKVCIPLFNPRVWDRELWQIERTIHFGVSPTIFVAELARASGALGALDLWYALWFWTVFGAWAWVAVQPEALVRRRFALGCGLLWVGGAVIYALVPVLGPFYAFPEIYEELRGSWSHAAPTQELLASNYAKILAGRDGSLRQFSPYLGIAAMPSLHVAAHWFFALWTRRLAPRLFPVAAAGTALTFVGSIATGWHYAVDGYVGILLAWGVFVVVERLEPVEDTPGAAEVAPPAEGASFTASASA